MSTSGSKGKALFAGVLLLLVIIIAVAVVFSASILFGSTCKDIKEALKLLENRQGAAAFKEFQTRFSRIVHWGGLKPSHLGEGENAWPLGSQDEFFEITGTPKSCFDKYKELINKACPTCKNVSDEQVPPVVYWTGHLSGGGQQLELPNVVKPTCKPIEEAITEAKGDTVTDKLKSLKNWFNTKYGWDGLVAAHLNIKIRSEVPESFLTAAESTAECFVDYMIKISKALPTLACTDITQWVTGKNDPVSGKEILYLKKVFADHVGWDGFMEDHLSIGSVGDVPKSFVMATGEPKDCLVKYVKTVNMSFPVCGKCDDITGVLAEGRKGDTAVKRLEQMVKVLNGKFDWFPIGFEIADLVKPKNEIEDKLIRATDINKKCVMEYIKEMKKIVYCEIDRALLVEKFVVDDKLRDVVLSTFPQAGDVLSTHGKFFKNVDEEKWKSTLQAFGFPDVCASEYAKKSGGVLGEFFEDFFIMKELRRVKRLCLKAEDISHEIKIFPRKKSQSASEIVCDAGNGCGELSLFNAATASGKIGDWYCYADYSYETYISEEDVKGVSCHFGGDGNLERVPCGYNVNTDSNTVSLVLICKKGKEDVVTDDQHKCVDCSANTEGESLCLLKIRGGNFVVQKVKVE